MTEDFSVRFEADSSLIGGGAGLTPGSGPELPPDLEPEMTRMVRALAGRLHARLPQGCGLEVGDLIQAGNVGLLKAVKAFECEVGTPILGYAKFRVRGEMLDLVRRQLGRVAPSPVSAANATGDCEQVLPASVESSPQSPLFTRQRATIIHEEVERLPAKYRALVRLRYSGELTLREIGAELRVNESRVSQLHRKALVRLKKALSSRGVCEFSQL